MTEVKPSDERPYEGPALPPAGVADERFAVNVRENRERQKLSQADIARRMTEAGWSWHPQTVQRIEAGHRKVTVGEAQALGQILGETVDRLTWPGRVASCAGLLNMSMGRLNQAWERIERGTSMMLWNLAQLQTTVGEAEKGDYLGSAKIRQLVAEAREV